MDDPSPESETNEPLAADTTIPDPLAGPNTVTDNTNTSSSSSNDALDALVLSRHHFSDLGPSGSWTVSSAKPGFDISLVQDSSLETYWQSDGPQPHHINIHFPRLVEFKYLSIYLNFGLDESYTPNAIRIMSGMGHHTLLEVQTLEFNEPTGWHHVDLTQHLGPGVSSNSGRDDDGTDTLFPTRLIQLQILSNHQNGKDTHVRAIKLHTPVTKSVVVEDGISFQTSLFSDQDLVR